MKAQRPLQSQTHSPVYSHTDILMVLLHLQPCKCFIINKNQCGVRCLTQRQFFICLWLYTFDMDRQGKDQICELLIKDWLHSLCTTAAPYLVRMGDDGAKLVPIPMNTILLFVGVHLLVYPLRGSPHQISFHWFTQQVTPDDTTLHFNRAGDWHRGT